MNESRAILKNFIFQKDIEDVFSCNGVRNPARNLDIKILLGCSLRKDFFESIYQIFILSFEAVNNFIFFLNMSLQLLDLMFITIDFIVMNVLEFFDFSLSCFLHIVCLALNKRIIFALLCLPSSEALLCFSSQISFSFLKMGNFLIT